MEVLTTELRNLDHGDLQWIASRLTKQDSDFQNKLTSGVLSGLIAVVVDHGEIIGWCRTEEWVECGDTRWDTLEAFVDPAYRGRGVATLAARALYSDFFHDTGGAVAVFSPQMMLVARNAGLHPTMFRREVHWTRA
jgi:ribosomal protein S18 acetylase RimI-like enzyme